jgi:hypothetical protein
VRSDGDVFCCPHAGHPLKPSASATRDELAALAAHLYTCSGLSTLRIGETGALRDCAQGTRGRTPFLRRWRAGSQRSGGL